MSVSGKTITVNGIETHYRSAGSGPPLLLIHGGQFGGTGGSVWPQSLVESLSESNTVVVPDRLGQGLTGNPTSVEQYRMSVAVEHMRSFLKALDISDADVIGHSRGAYTAARLSMLDSGLFRRLVFVNSASLALDYDGEARPGTLTFRVYNELATGNPEHDLRLSAVRQEYITPEFVDRCRRELSAAKNVEARSTLAGPAHRGYYDEFKSTRAELLAWLASQGGTPKPTMIVWGVGDPTTTANEGLDLYTHLSRAGGLVRLYMINQCGHAPFLEYEREFQQLVSDFLKRTDDKPPLRVAGEGANIEEIDRSGIDSI